MQINTGNLISATLLLVLVIAQVNARFDVKIIKPKMEGHYVIEGERVEIECSYMQPKGQKSKIGITLENREIPFTDSGPHVIQNSNWTGISDSPDYDEVQYYKLSFHNITLGDAGEYQCRDLTGAAGDHFELKLNVFRVESTDALVSKNETNATLGCNIVTSPFNQKPESPSATIWYRKSMTGELTEMITKGNVTVSQTELTITHVEYKKYDSVGEYICQLKPSTTSRTVNVTLSVNVAAGVKKLVKDYSTKGWHGDAKDVIFQVYGFPIPEVRWTKDGDLINDSRVRVTGKNGTIVNDTLHFTKLEYTDRGMYRCEVSNVYGNGSAEIFVRVKDPLAALWPFLGILAQGLILFLIIFFYERRKKEKKSEEDVAAPRYSKSHDNIVLNQANPDDTPTNVRQRTTPNDGASTSTSI